MNHPVGIMVNGFFTCERLYGWGGAFHWVRCCIYFASRPRPKPVYSLAA